MRHSGFPLAGGERAKSKAKPEDDCFFQVFHKSGGKRIQLDNVSDFCIFYKYTGLSKLSSRTAQQDIAVFPEVETA